MKRRSVFFVLLVFGLLVVGYLKERKRGSEPESFTFSEPAAPTFEALLPPTGTERLHGRVVDTAGTGVEGLEVFLHPADPVPRAASPLHWTLTDDEGDFSLDRLQARRYGVILFQPGREPEELEVVIPVEVSVLWRLQKEPPGPLDSLPAVVRVDLVGRVRVPSDHADAALLSPTGYEVALVPLDDDVFALTGAVRRRAPVDAAGLFRFDDVVTADYRLELLPPWARSGTWPVLDAVDLRHSEGGVASPVLTIRSGSVTGDVLDLEGRPIEGALVQLRSEQHPERLWPASTTDALGTFRVGDLPAGRYLLEIGAGTARRELSVDVREGVSHRISFAPVDPRR